MMVAGVETLHLFLFGRSWLRIYAQSSAFLFSRYLASFPRLLDMLRYYFITPIGLFLPHVLHFISHSFTLCYINIWESVGHWTKVWVLFSIDIFLTRREIMKFKSEQNKKCRHKQVWVISDFRRGVNGILALLGWQLPTFRNSYRSYLQSAQEEFLVVPKLLSLSTSIRCKTTNNSEDLINKYWRRVLSRSLLVHWIILEPI